MAERTADAAAQAAATARRAADSAARLANDTKSGRLKNANGIVTVTETDETAARAAYHHAEHDARERIAHS
jgi:hypothetical protein